jgi:hypothetical protein
LVTVALVHLASKQGTLVVPTDVGIHQFLAVDVPRRDVATRTFTASTAPI